MNKMYLVQYSTGSYDSFYQNKLFVTSDENFAKQYVEKFNRILECGKQYMSKFDDPEFDWIKDEYIEKYFYRWIAFRETNQCYYQEIEVR